MKAEAAATAVVVGGSVLIAAALTALGIGLSNGYNNHEWNQKCQSIWDGMSEAVRDTITVVTHTGDQGAVIAKCSVDLLSATYQGFAATFPPGTPLGTFSSNEEFAQKVGWSQTFNPPNYSGAVPWGTSLAVYSLQNVCLIKTYTKSDLPFNRNGLNVSVLSNDYIGSFTVSVSDTTSQYFSSVRKFIPFHNGSFILNSVSWAEFSAYDPATKCDVWLFLSSSGGTGYEGFKDAATTPADPTEVNTHDPYVPGDPNVYAQGHSIMNNSYDDVMSKIKAAQGSLDSINLKISDAVGNLSEINDQIRARTQAQEIGQSIADTATDAAANTATNAGRDTTVPQAPAMPNMMIPSAITKKFPFSIPWDLFNSVGVLASPSEAPKWTFPFGKDSIVIDMAPYGVPAAVARWGLSLLFLIGLILLTNKVIKH